MAPIVSRYLDPRAICPRLEAADASEVISRLADRLLLIGSVKESYREAVIQRELAMPTGLPIAADFAVAVPHTDPEHVLKPAVALATLKTPVLFRSMDDPDETLQVKVVFALALRDKNEQIEMLQSIVAILQDATTLRRIAEASTLEQLIDAMNVEAV